MSTPTTTHASVTLDAEGRGAVTIDGTPQPLAGPDLATGREQARLRVVEHAQRVGGPVRFLVTEPAGTRDLIASPDGNVTPAPAEDQLVITTPAWEQPAPAAAQPPAEEVEDRKSTRLNSSHVS